MQLKSMNKLRAKNILKSKMRVRATICMKYIKSLRNINFKGEFIK